jgi:heme A synthase
LRIIHPIVAVLTGLLLVRVVSSRRVPDAPRRGRWARAVIVLVVAQIVAGGSNIALLTPIWMQLIHLLLADALWISFVWFIFDVRRDQSWAMNSSSEDTGAAHTIPSQT